MPIGKYDKEPSFQEFIIENYGYSWWNEIKPIQPRVKYSYPREENKERVAKRKEYREIYAKHLAERTSLKAAPANIYYQENKSRKLSRLKPKLTDSNFELRCSPTFQEGIDPDSTKTYENGKWGCDNAFMLAKQRGSTYSDSKRFGIFDLNLQSSGNVEIIEKVDYIPVIITGENSTASIMGARYGAQNIFLVRDGFKGEIIGDPLLETNHSNTSSTLSTSLVNEKWTVSFDGKILRMHETNLDKLGQGKLISEAKTYYITSYIGHPGQDKLNCSNDTLLYEVNTLGGKPNAMDQITNCKQALLHSHTEIFNTKLGTARYSIRPDSSDIVMHHGANQITFFLLPTDIGTFLKDHHFQYSLKENTFWIKNTNGVFLLTIYPFIQENSSIIFLDSENASISPMFSQLSQDGKEQVNSLVNHTSFRYTASADSIADAHHKHEALTSTNPDKKFLVSFKYKASLSEKEAIIGNTDDNLIVFEDLSQLNYVAGLDGDDQYVLTKRSMDTIKEYENYSITINNYAQFGVDSLYLPFSIKQIDCLVKDLDLELHCLTHPNFTIVISKYFSDKSYQHLIIVDSDGNYFIPMRNEQGKLSLVPYQIITENTIDLFTEINSEQGQKVVVENRLPKDFVPYRYYKNLLLINNNSEGNIGVFNVPINQIVSIEQAQFFTTQGASFVDENNVKPRIVHLNEYLNMADELTTATQKAFESELIDYYTVTEASLSVQTIYHNPPGKKQKQGYLVLERKVIEKFNLTSSQNNLIWGLFDKQQQSRTLISQNWEKLEHRLQGIIIDGKVLIDDLPDFSLDNIEQLTHHINSALLTHWIDEQLQSMPPGTYALALDIIVRNNLTSKKALETLGFDSEQDIQNFLKAVTDDKLNQDSHYHQLGETILWIYLKLAMQYKRNLLVRLVSPKMVEHFFHDFDYQFNTRPHELREYFSDGVGYFHKEVLNAVEALNSAEPMQAEESRYQIAKAENKERKPKNEECWWQSVSSWIYGATVTAATTGALGYLRWRFTRRRRHRLGQIGGSTAAALAAYAQIPTAEADSTGVIGATLIQMTHEFSTEANSSGHESQGRLGEKATEKPFEQMNDFGREGNSTHLPALPIQGFLSLLDIVIRSFTEVKYKAEGYQSFQTKQEAYVNKLSPEILTAVNMTEEDLLNKIFVEPGVDYFALARGNNSANNMAEEGGSSSFSFSNSNLFAEENDWGIKTKPRKKTKKERQERML